MNRDSKGAGITDRAPNQAGGEKGSTAAHGAQASGSGSSSQPPSNPNKQKDDSNTSTSSRKSLKDMAQDKLNEGNASQLGDPVSLKAETSDSSPTNEDRGAGQDPESAGPADSGTGASGSGSSNEKKEQAKRNIGEAKKTSPTEGDGEGKPKEQKSLKELAESNPSMLGDPVSLKAESSDSEPTEEDRGAGKGGMSNEERKKRERGSKL